MPTYIEPLFIPYIEPLFIPHSYSFPLQLNSTVQRYKITRTYTKKAPQELSTERRQNLDTLRPTSLDPVHKLVSCLYSCAALYRNQRSNCSLHIKLLIN